MADGYVSSIQLPNNNTYNIKDKNAITEIQIVGETQTKTNGVVNLPARVTQSNSSSNQFRPILTGYESWNSMESYTTGSVTNSIYKSAKAFLRTSNGTFYGGYFVAANPVSGGNGNTAKRATLNSDGIYANNYLDGYPITPYERQIIQAYAGKSRDANGLLLKIDSGGLTIVGGGESGESLANLIANDQTVESPARLDINNSQGETGKETTAYNGSSEHLVLSSDGNIYFVTGCGTIDNRVGVCLNSARTFYPMTNNTGKIGASNYKWQYGYFGQVYGTGGSGKWKAARDKASFINSTPPNENAYAPAIDLKTTSGDWSIGTLDGNENLYFAYVADSIYSGSTNVVRRYNLQAPSTPDSNTYDILHSGNTSFTQTLSSGTEIGTITINGTDTVLYCQTNTDEKVKTNLIVAENLSTSYYLTATGNTNETAKSLYMNNNVTIRIQTGTASTLGRARLVLGNNTAEGTAGNCCGQLLLYSTDNGYSVLRQETGVQSTGITIYLPPKAGTIFNTGNLVAGDNITLTQSNGVYSINGTANTDTKNTAGSTDTSDKIFLIGAKSQAANPQTYSDDQVYVADGSLYLTKANIDAEGTKDNKPALLIGNPTGTHLELDANELMAKGSTITTGPLYLNNNGGLVYANNKKVVRLTSDPTSGEVMIADGTDGQIKSSGKTIVTSITNTDDTLPTAKAVKTFVEGKGYVTTDEKVKQEYTTSGNDYRVLLSYGANNTTETKGARKSEYLLFNPSTKTLTTTNLQVGGGTDSGTLTLYTYLNGAFISGELIQPYNGTGGTITHSLPLIGGDLFGSGNVSAGAGITINASGDRYTIESKNKFYLRKTYTSLFSDIDDDTFRNCKYFKIYYKDSNNCNYNCITINMNTDVFPTSSTTSYIKGKIFTLSCVGDVNKTYLRTATFHFETKSGGGVWKLVFNSSFLWDPSAAIGSSITWTSTKQTSYSNSYIEIIKLEYFLEDT